VNAQELGFESTETPKTDRSVRLFVPSRGCCLFSVRVICSVDFYQRVALIQFDLLMSVFLFITVI
jgi:hypothetical protein